jgi:hypothetical protein
MALENEWQKAVFVSACGRTEASILGDAAALSGIRHPRKTNDASRPPVPSAAPAIANGIRNGIKPFMSASTSRAKRDTARRSSAILAFSCQRDNATESHHVTHFRR